MQDETQDPMYRGQADMRGSINTVGVEEAARIVADAYAPPFSLDAHARLQGIIRAAFEAGQLDGLTNNRQAAY
jgi:hypothetical protein